MTIQQQFDKAVEIVKALPKDGPVRPTDDDQLYFYARFKQVNVGDVNTDRPGMFDFTGKAKWDAWNAIKGKAKEEAMKEYVDKLVELLKKAGDADSKAKAAEIEAAA